MLHAPPVGVSIRTSATPSWLRSVLRRDLWCRVSRRHTCGELRKASSETRRGSPRTLPRASRAYPAWACRRPALAAAQ